MAKLTKTESVALLYAKYFGKTADKGTIDNYVSIGKTSKILKQIIKDSNIEQYSVHGDDLKAEVHNEFQNLFSRNADNTELEKYVKVLKKGKNLPINSIVKKASKFDKDVYKNKQEIAKFVAENGGGVFDLSKVTKANPIDVKSLTSLTDLKTKIDVLPENSNVPSTFDGETYILTTDVNTFKGTAKDDTFLSSTINHWSVGDSIDGGKGVDTLKIIDATAAIAQTNVIPTGSTIKNVEILDIISGGSTVTADTTSIDGVTHLYTTSTGANTSTAAATTDIKATATNGAIIVNGGKDVTVVSKDNNDATDIITVGGTTAAAGTVSITTNIAANTTAAGAISVKGGTTVSVTETIAAPTAGVVNATVGQGNVSVTGTATTTSVTVDQAAATAGVKEVFTATFATGLTAADTVVFDGVTYTVAVGGTATAAASATAFTAAYNLAGAANWVAVDNGNGTVTFTAKAAGALTDILSTNFTGTGTGVGAVTAATPTTQGIAAVTNGTVTITDANAGSTTAAATIATATLSDYGTSTISSNALSTLNLSGTAGTLGLTTGLTTPTNTTLTMNLNKLSVSTNNTITDSTAGTGVGYKTLNINSSTADSTLTALNFADVETLNVSGDAKLTITGANTLTAVKDIVVTNTAGFDLGTTTLAVGTTFTGGAGNDTIILTGAQTKAITMGAGNDKVTYAGALGTGGSVAAGDGNDTIVMTVAQADNATGASANSVFNSSFTGFETLELKTSAIATINLTGINAVSTVVMATGVGHAIVLDNLVSNGKVKLNASATAGSLTINVKDALLTNTDVLNLELSNTGILAAGSITAANVETININVADAATLGSAAVVHTANLTLADAKSIVVAGNNGLNFTTSTVTKVTNFDASGVVANNTATTTDTAANLKVTFTSGNTDVAANVSIKGGAGNDVLTGNAAIDTITGGAGNDILDGKGGADIINVGEGRDVVVIGATDSTTAAFDSINGFTLATKDAVVFGNQNGFLTGTTGGSNVSILEIGSVNIETNITAAAGQHAGVTYTIKDGILTLGGVGASTVDTLGEWLAEAQAALGTAAGDIGDTLAFQFGSDTYVYTEKGATDIFVKLVGVTGANALVDGYSNAATVDNTILIG